MNYYKRFPGDYSRDTAHLSLAEHGAYALLLDVYYATGRPLVNDLAAVYRICRAFTAAERKAVDSVLNQFFLPDGDLLRNARADREIEAEQVRISKARENGNRGGRPRKNQNETQEKPSGFQEETHEGSEKKALQRQHHVTTSQGLTTFTPDPPDGEGFELNPEAKDLHPAKPTQLSPSTARAREANAVPVSAETWDAYSTAYRQRYSVDPVRNATVNAQLAAFVKRLGAEEAPQVAAFYVRHNKAFYVSRQHATGPMLADAEGLRTEWATGRMMTDTEARQADRKQTNLSIAEQLIAEERRKHG